MKPQLLKFALPISLGLILMAITISGIITTTFVGCKKDTTCPSGQCAGDNGHCYSCSSGSYCTKTPSGNCSASISGVACCTGSSGGGGGGGCTPTGCASSTPWLCGGYCYSTPPSGNHACIKCP